MGFALFAPILCLESVLPASLYWRLSGYYFCHFAFIGVFSPYFSLYLKSLSLSAWDIGLVAGQMQLMRMFAPAFWGWLADRQARRISLVRLAAGVSVLAVTGLYYARTPWPLLGAVGLLSFFWAASLPLMETLVFNHLGANPQGYSRIRLWGSVGFIVTVLGVGAWLDHAGPWVVPTAFLVLMSGVFLFSLAVPEGRGTVRKGAAVSLKAVLAQPRVRALLGAAFCMSAAHGAYYVFYSIHLTEHGYSKTLVGLLWSLGVVVEIGVFYFLHRLLKRFSLRFLLLLAFGAAVLRFVAIGWGAGYLALLLLAQACHGLTFGAHHGVSISAINRWFPGQCQARGQALYSALSFGAGGLLGSVVSGWTWTAWGPAWTFSLSALFALLGWGLVALWVREGAGEGKP